MMCVALKDFVANGDEILRNQLVDAKDFRNGQTLVTTRYLRPATQDEIESAVEVDDTPKPAPVPVMRAKVKRAKRA